MLDMLHDAGDEYILAVAYCIHLELLAQNVFVDQHGRLLVYLDGGAQIETQRLLVADDLHGAAAQHEARTHQYGITDTLGGGNARLDVGDGFGLRLRYADLVHDALEALAVLGVVDGLDVGSDDLDAQLGQRLGQIYGCLSAERYHDTVGMLQLNDIHDVLYRQGLEVEFVADRIVGRYGFGVVVYDDGLVTGILDGPYCVYGRVVELDALTVTYGA